MLAAPQTSPLDLTDNQTDDFAERDEVSGVRKLPRFLHEALRDMSTHARLLPPEIVDMSAHARLLPPRVPVSRSVRRALRFVHIFEALSPL